MSKQKGYHFYCVVKNDKIIRTSKLVPQTMLDLMRFVIEKFGDNDYDSVVDILNYWPVDFTTKYTKPVQCLYLSHDEDTHEVISVGYIVYASNKTNAEKAMQAHLNGKHYKEEVYGV